MLVVKLRRSRDAPGARPISVSDGHASSMYWRRLASAFGAGSVAITSNPRARDCAAQLAPITPVPTIAIRRIGLFELIVDSTWMFRIGRRERGSRRDQEQPQCRGLILHKTARITGRPNAGVKRGR